MPACRLRAAVAAAALGCVAVGCSAMAVPQPDPPRECAEIAADRLPAIEEFLDPSELVPALRQMPGEEDEVLLTVATRADGEEIRIFRPGSENEGSLGLWPVVLREVLRTPPPEGAAPGLRVRLTPGPEGGARLEPATLCEPELRNREEVEERFRVQMASAGGPPVSVRATFLLSDLGGIQGLSLEMPEGSEGLELFARRAFHFARFRPALLDGRRIPSALTLEFPADS